MINLDGIDILENFCDIFDASLIIIAPKVAVKNLIELLIEQVFLSVD